MAELAVKVEKVYKEYRLGAIGGGSLKKDVQSKIARFLKKDDPNLKIGEKSYEKNERFMAINGMSFEVEKGETIGIIGHNGAGKSTILKLICRITTPTKGNIYLNGRITSMLEVGTGFHPELTGRENVYLNGAILGMSKAEIDKKFDEIVEFSEVGQFIDTPIKRYSSGMKVKLAFAVASHLDSEIMIMDEVLAVGDVNFQNKCIERMKKVATEEGRTILYVSHNMATVKSLCNRCIVLSKGQVIFEGNTEEAIAVYMKNEALDDTTFFDVSKADRFVTCNKKHFLHNIEILNKYKPVIEYGEKFCFKAKWLSENYEDNLKMKLLVKSMDATPVGIVFCGALSHKRGVNEKVFIFDTSYFIPGKYTVEILFYNDDELGNVILYDRVAALRFTIEHSDESVELKHWLKAWGNAVLPCVEQVEE